MEIIGGDDLILKTKTKIFDFNSNIDLDFIEYEMFKLLEENNGIGLAAPQVGISERFFISPLISNTLIINPEIIFTSKETEVRKEGCLSFPNLFLSVRRPKNIIVKFLNKKEQIIEKSLENLSARCFYHEVDHLDGILFMDRATKLSIQMAKLKGRKIK